MEKPSFEYWWLAGDCSDKSVYETLERILRHETISRSDWSLIFVQIYKHCCADDKNHIGLLMRGGMLVHSYVTSIEKSLEQIPESDFLKTYHTEWQRFVRTMERISCVFRYVDRVYAASISMGIWESGEVDLSFASESLPSAFNCEGPFTISQLGMGFWHVLIVERNAERFRHCILRDFEARRNQQPHEHDQIITPIAHSFVVCRHVALNSNSSTNPDLSSLDPIDLQLFEQIYRQNDFLKAAQIQTASLAAKVQAKFDNSNPIQSLLEYEQSIVEALEIENSIFQVHCLSLPQINRVASEIGHGVVGAHSETLRKVYEGVASEAYKTFEQSGGDDSSLNEFFDVTRIINFLMRISDMNDKTFEVDFGKLIENVFASYLTKQLEVQRDTKLSQSNALLALAEFHERLYNRLISYVGKTRPNFESSFENAFSRVLNSICKDDSTARLLALTFDIQIRRMAKCAFKGEKSAKHDDDIKRLCVLFKYIEDKDEFAETHKKYLAARLISNIGLNEDQSILEFLKDYCGLDFANQMSSMVTDSLISRDLVKEYCGDRWFDVKMLRNTVWPLSSSKDNLSLGLGREAMDSFEKFYKEKFPNRRLLWSHSASSVELRARFGEKSYIFVVNHYQYAILNILDVSESLSESQLAASTGIPLEQLTADLRVLLEYAIIKKTDDQKFGINKDFNQHNNRLCLNSLTHFLTSNYRSKDKQHERIEIQRKNYCMSYMTRILKKEKTMKKAILFDQVKNQASASFQPNDQIMEAALKGLIEQEIVKTDDGDTVDYLA